MGVGVELKTSLPFPAGKKAWKAPSPSKHMALCMPMPILGVTKLDAEMNEPSTSLTTGDQKYNL